MKKNIFFLFILTFNLNVFSQTKLDFLDSEGDIINEYDLKNLYSRKISNRGIYLGPEKLSEDVYIGNEFLLINSGNHIEIFSFDNNMIEKLNLSHHFSDNERSYQDIRFINNDYFISYYYEYKNKRMKEKDPGPKINYLGCYPYVYFFDSKELIKLNSESKQAKFNIVKDRSYDHKFFSTNKDALYKVNLKTNDFKKAYNFSPKEKLPYAYKNLYYYSDGKVHQYKIINDNLLISFNYEGRFFYNSSKSKELNFTATGVDPIKTLKIFKINDSQLTRLENDLANNKFDKTVRLKKAYEIVPNKKIVMCVDGYCNNETMQTVFSKNKIGIPFTGFVDGFAFTTEGLINEKGEIVIPRKIELNKYSEEELLNITETIIENAHKHQLLDYKISGLNGKNTYWVKPYTIWSHRGTTISTSIKYSNPIFSYNIYDKLNSSMKKGEYLEFLAKNVMPDITFWVFSKSDSYNWNSKNSSIFYGNLNINFMINNYEHIKELKEFMDKRPEYQDNLQNEDIYYGKFPFLMFQFMNSENDISNFYEGESKVFKGGNKLIAIKDVINKHSINYKAFSGNSYQLARSDRPSTKKFVVPSKINISNRQFNQTINYKYKESGAYKLNPSSYEIISGKEYVYVSGYNDGNKAYISITDGGNEMTGSNVCSDNYFVEYKQENGYSTKEDSPFMDSGSFDMFPSYVTINYQPSCGKTTRFIKIKINSPGQYDINIK